ncbi:hypothetical protein PS1_002579 [Malus domestica]
MPCPSGQSISRHSSCVSQKTLRIQLVHSHLLPFTDLLHGITSAFVSLSLLKYFTDLRFYAITNLSPFMC